MFRHKEDYIRGINCLCLAAHKTDSTLLAYSFMSNHAHIGVRTECPEMLIRHFRYPYNRYFNNKYGHQGRLGEKEFFKMEIDGLYHLLTVIAYILRNPLHHGVAATPFGYRFSSISALFSEELGRFYEPELMPVKSQYLYLPEGVRLPSGYRMDTSGLILPESVIDVADMEHQFSTARTFLYYMNRLSGENWMKEQLQDDTQTPPVTLEDMELGITCQDTKTMLINEHGRTNYNAISDITLCETIDNFLSERTIYELTEKELVAVADYLTREYRITTEQLKRCLGGRIF